MPAQVSSEAAQRAYLVGLDGVPWISRNVLADGILRIHRATSESGQLVVPWSVPGRGVLTLRTASLRETDQPYLLPVELARGTIGRLRDRIAEWQTTGWQPSAQVQARLRRATQAFAKATTSQHIPAAATRAADAALAEACDAVELAMSEGALASIRQRQQDPQRWNILLAANLGTSSASELPADFSETFNAAVIAFPWNEIEGHVGSDEYDKYSQQIAWCRAKGLRICGGPLINFHRHGLPDWLYLWEEDYDSLLSYMNRYVETIVGQFLGKVNLWHCWAGLNCGVPMDVPEEFRLRVAVSTVETLRRSDPTAPVIVTIDQPWGQYQSRREHDLTPMHYADTLLRAGLGVSGIGLELNMGYWPHGTLARDLLEVSQLIDRWALFGVPLVIFLTLPSQSTRDPQAAFPDEDVQGVFADQVDSSTQAISSQQLIRVLLGKPSVQGIVWNQLHDAARHAFPHGGLFDSQGHRKPVFDALREIRLRDLDQRL